MADRENVTLGDGGKGLDHRTGEGMTAMLARRVRGTRSVKGDG